MNKYHWILCFRILRYDYAPVWLDLYHWEALVKSEIELRLVRFVAPMAPLEQFHDNEIRLDYFYQMTYLVRRVADCLEERSSFEEAVSRLLVQKGGGGGGFVARQVGHEEELLVVDRGRGHDDSERHESAGGSRISDFQF